MALDRLLGEEEPVADLAIHETFRDELEDFDLARRRHVLALGRCRPGRELDQVRRPGCGGRPPSGSDGSARDTGSGSPHAELRPQWAVSARHEPCFRRSSLNRSGTPRLRIARTARRRARSSSGSSLLDDAEAVARRRVEDPPAAEPERDVIGALGPAVGDEIAWPLGPCLDRRSRGLLLPGVARDEPPGGPVGDVDEPRAVDPAARQPAPLVRRPEIRRARPRAARRRRPGSSPSPSSSASAPPSRGSRTRSRSRPALAALLDLERLVREAPGSPARRRRWAPPAPARPRPRTSPH